MDQRRKDSIALAFVFPRHRRGERCQPPYRPMSLQLAFLAVLCLGSARVSRGGNCSARYLRLSVHHTKCADRNPECDIIDRGVTDGDRKLILRQHNEMRNRVATGEESRAGGMPPAANTLQMMWDEELAEIAQKHAEICLYEHDCNECRAVDHFLVGQNIGIRWSSSRKLVEKDWESFLRSLYEEVAYFHKNLVDSYLFGPLDPVTQYGHFSQIIWAKTWRVGCGWVLFKSGFDIKSFYICNYGKAGNIQHEKVYEEGPHCTACPGNTCCGKTCEEFNITSEYSGLCKLIDESLPPEGFGSLDPRDVFFCDFYNESDCEMTTGGRSDWQLVQTIGGNWISIVLKGGETASLTMNKPLKSMEDVFCFELAFRTGPEISGQPKGFMGGIMFLTDDWKSATFNFRNTNFHHRFVPHKLLVNLKAYDNIKVCTL